MPFALPGEVMPDHPGRRLMRSMIQTPLPISLFDYSLSKPLVIAHRGGSLTGPEDTNPAYQESVNGGGFVIEQDVQTLSDGSLGIMHDTTVDRTTTGTGPVSSFTEATFTALVCDYQNYLGGNYGTVHPPMFIPVLNEFVGRAIFAPEVKGGEHVPVINAMLAAGVAGDQAVLADFGLEAPTAAVAAGYQGMYGRSNGDTTNIAACAAAGIKYVALPNTTVDASIAAWIAGGVNPVIYTVERRVTMAQWIAKGVFCFYSDDAIYTGRTTPFATQDTFVTQRWMPGMIHMSNGLDATTRGAFYSGGYWGWADVPGTSQFVMQGWACPVVANPVTQGYSIDFTILFGPSAVTNDSALIFLAAQSMVDARYSDVNGGTEQGYQAIIRPSTGNLDIYKRTGGTSTMIQRVASPAMPDGSVVRFRFSSTPTQIILQRLNSSGVPTQTNAINDTDFRGAYFHFGHRGMPLYFKEVFTTIIP